MRDHLYIVQITIIGVGKHCMHRYCLSYDALSSLSKVASCKVARRKRFNQTRPKVTTYFVQLHFVLTNTQALVYNMAP